MSKIKSWELGGDGSGLILAFRGSADQSCAQFAAQDFTGKKSFIQILDLA